MYQQQWYVSFRVNLSVMKKIYITILLSALLQIVYGQSNMREGEHIFNYNVRLAKVDDSGVPSIPAGTEYIKAETRFVITSILPNEYVIRIVNFKNNSSENTRLVKSANKEIFFLLPQLLYVSDAERLKEKGSFTVGVATTLLKIRPGSKETENRTTINSDFGNDFNLGFSAGWKIQPKRKKQTFHSVVFGLSMSAIDVTPYSTRDHIKENATQSAITISPGYIFEIDKFQMGIFPGLDMMSGAIGRKWIYRNRPWLGIGFGYSIFRADGEKGN
jgi:hypothetical protein